MPSQIQPTFASGEITPSAYGRIDIAKYGSGLRTLRNMVTRVHGGVVNRPGTEFIAKVKYPELPGRLIPFEFSSSQSYVLVFQHLVMRVVKDGGMVLEANKTITATTDAAPVVITSVAHGYANGDEVFISGTGIVTVDNRFWIVANVTADTFELVDSAAPGVTAAVGTVARIYELVSPYAESQLPLLKFTQLADVMTITHNDVRPQNLSRSDHAAWAFSDMPFEQGPFQDQNVDKDKLMQASAVTGVGIFITAFGHTPFLPEHVGMLLYLEQKDYGVPWEVDKAVNAGDIRRSEGKYYRALNSADTGTLRPFHDNDVASDGEVEWLYVHNGYGIALITGFTDSTHVGATVLNELPAEVVSTQTYKWALGAWGGDQGWPGCVVYFQQRRCLAATIKQPQKIWMSGTDAYSFFGRSSPIADDDAISMTLASNQINAIRHMVSFGKLVIFTSGGKWVLPDDDNNPILTPVKRSARQQGSIGASQMRPVIVEDTVLYGAAKGETVHDLAYQFASNAYAGTDLSVLSKHLLEGHAPTASAYQHVPFQIYWQVRDDGVLIGMTYLKEHEVWGWHHHDTEGGCFIDICTITEGAEDRVYLLVQRFVDGVGQLYIERLASRLYIDIKDAWFVDSGLKYDGRNLPPEITCGPGPTPTAIAGGCPASEPGPQELPVACCYNSNGFGELTGNDAGMFSYVTPAGDFWHTASLMSGFGSGPYPAATPTRTWYLLKPSSPGIDGVCDLEEDTPLTLPGGRTANFTSTQTPQAGTCGRSDEKIYKLVLSDVSPPVWPIENGPGFIGSPGAANGGQWIFGENVGVNCLYHSGNAGISSLWAVIGSNFYAAPGAASGHHTFLRWPLGDKFTYQDLSVNREDMLLGWDNGTFNTESAIRQFHGNEDYLFFIVQGPFDGGPTTWRLYRVNRDDLTYSAHWVLTGDANFPTPWGLHVFSNDLVFLVQGGNDASPWKIGYFKTASAVTSVIGTVAGQCTAAGHAIGPVDQHGFAYAKNYFYLSYSGYGFGVTNVLKLGPLVCPTIPELPWED